MTRIRNVLRKWHLRRVVLKLTSRTTKTCEVCKRTKITRACTRRIYDLERRDPLNSDIPQWLQEFRENLVDDRVPEHRDSHASSSHEASLEPIFKRREDLGKHSVYTHFPKDRNCEICKRTKITRAPCRRRIGGAVPRAEILVTW